MSNFYTLLASCRDQCGLIAKITTYFANLNMWIMESKFFSDEISQQYFMRIEIKANADDSMEKFENLKNDFQQQIATPLNLRWRLLNNNIPNRVVLMVSQQEHCLYDLMARWQSAEFESCNAKIVGVISNHQRFENFVLWHQIPFFYVPINSKNSTQKAEAFAKMQDILKNTLRADTIVLARYMQILPPDFCHNFAGKIINIHHSFLPSFIGAKPYHQAYERGVKLIGETCHYVTENLDAGPIIEQDVIRVDHTDTPEKMVRYGKDIEKTVLARGLRYHLENRVIIDGNKTIVFK